MGDSGKIALLLGQADEAYQSEFVKGVMEQAFKDGFSVCVFSMYIKYQNSKEREIGDSNIFNLVNYQMFDAVIILSDTIQTPGVNERIEERIHAEFDGPVLCVDRDSKYFSSFWTDGYESVYAQVSHMIEEHGLKDIAYLTGRKNHPHSKRRMQAYEDAMQAHGLTANADRKYYGDFWYTSGAGCAESLLRDLDNLPEAVLCANDCMAIGLAEEFERNGIRIPRDIKIAGYGTTEEGQTSPKPLTSTFIPARYYGKYCVEMIERLSEGKELTKPDIDAKLFIGESCGCKPKHILNDRNIRDSWTTRASDDGYYSIHNTMLEDLQRCSTLDGFLTGVFENIHYLKGIKSFALVLNDLWMRPQDMINYEFPTEGYSSKVVLALSYDSKNANSNLLSTHKIFDKMILLPEMSKDEPEGYIFTPLFDETKSLGYAVISYGDKPQSYNEVFRLWINTLTGGLESLRRNLIVQALKERLALKESMKFADYLSGSSGELVQISEEERQELEEVKKILDDNILSYDFQPIVNAVDGEIYSYEALMRSGTERKISPLKIIKYANRLNRIRDVEKYTFLNVINLVDHNRQKFAGRKVFINSIPGIKLSKEDYGEIGKAFSEYPGDIVVELTEQAELKDDELDEVKRYISDIGAELAIDDYGTGYSNISNLLRYLPDVVKVDRSLLTGIQNSSQKQHFVSDIIEFCHSNNILALAEGVETSEELRTVIKLGADLIQGYYTARPSREIIPSIDEEIRNEIIRYHQEMVDGNLEQEYIAGRVNRISISNLLRENKNKVIIGAKDVTFRDITIVGTPGISPKMDVEILEDFDGRLTLENVVLSNKKKHPCIKLAENCTLTLHLIGYNILKNGGIMVPESSKLIIEGDGNLQIKVDGANSFGIGNDLSEKHGAIRFYQDGEIHLDMNGEKSIGIGSGNGGKIEINKGKYVIDINAKECVGIGAMNEASDIDIKECDIEVDFAADQGVAIGNYGQSVNVQMRNCLIKCTCAGKRIVSIGSLEGDSVSMKGKDMGVIINLRADSSIALGTMQGKTSIDFMNSFFKINQEGGKALCYGGFSEDTYACFTECDVNVELKTDLDKLSYAPAQNIVFKNARNKVILNGKAIK